MKKVITILVVCLAITGLNAQTMPFHFSTNTTDGAIWYHIMSDRNNAPKNEWHPIDATPNGLGGTPAIQWAEPNSEKDGQLFCFIGNNTDGFKVYNKMYLAGKTVPVYNELNANGLAPAPRTIKEEVTLLADIPLKNIDSFSGTAGKNLVFSTASYTGAALVDKFFLLEGAAEGSHPSSVAGTYKFYTYDYNIADETNRQLLANLVHWSISGGSTVQYSKNNTLAGVYCFQFIYVSGDIDTSLPQNIENKVSVSVADGVINVTGAEGTISLTSILGVSQQIKVQGDITSIPVDTQGIYIVVANGKSHKVLVQ